jgi:hypothetical protein
MLVSAHGCSADSRRGAAECPPPGVSPPVTRRLLVSEQASLAQLHAVLQVAFGWSDEHLYTFQIRGWQFGDPSRAILALAGGGVDIPLAAFAFEINESFRYQYNLFVPWEMDCRIEACGLVATSEPTCLAAQGDPPDEDLGGPAASHRALRTLEELTWDVGTESPRASELQEKLERIW